MGDRIEPPWAGINDTDPVEDPRFPRIREYRPGEDDPVWPDDVDEIEQAVADIEEMVAAAAGNGWGSGWPDCHPAKSDLATVEVNDAAGRVVARITVRKKLARLLDIILDHCARRGYVFHTNQCGGFNCRPIGGTRSPSNHSWGKATDLNWNLNPHRRPLTTNIPGWMVDLLERFLWAWGGRWSKPDTMHFEFSGTPADADRQTERAIRELLNGELPPVGQPTLRKDDTGPAVAEVQRLLGIKIDGHYGPATEAGVREFQQSRGLKADGICGPATWAALLKEDFMAALSDAQQRELYEWVKEGLGRPYDYRNHHGNPEDLHYGHVMALRKELAAAREQWDRIEAALPKAPTR
ncbi:MAG: peptidoglycan-binding protein [Actinomycetota bacterium]|nr:peptidoglycan-binding protein [Actinomycetota bacterium]